MLLAYRSHESGETNVQFRDHPAVQGKRDFYPVDPRKLKVDDAYNVRDMQAKETRDHIAWLKASIIAGGVHTPLEVRLDGKNIFVVAGHCRLAAVLEAIEEGNPIATVPCIPEAKGTDEIDRTVNLVISNSGKPLSPLEVAKVVKRLQGYGWEPKQIAERLGWKSTNTVKQHLDMLALPEGVKKHVREGNVSATTARHLAKGVDPDEAEKMIQANLEENRRIKGPRRRTTVTRKTIERDRPKPRAAEAKYEPQPVPEPVAASETVSIVFGKSGGAGGGNSLSSQPPEQMPAPVAEQRETSIQPANPDWNGPTLADCQVRIESFERPPAGVKDLIDALAPFAHCAELNLLYARDDSEVIEVLVGDIKRAWKAWSKATGADVKDAA
jgi:ParB-like chromosome segregation protein Spo0J